ncbi:hypothetical protein M569_09039, partial [Genlisea aurea]
KKRWKSIVPLNLTERSARLFCLFSETESENDEDRVRKTSNVYLNVYDLTAVNGYVYWAGLGIFHSGVEVHGVEYAFGAHDFSSSGVFEVEPRQCPGFNFRKSILIGTTTMDPFKVRHFIERLAANYNGDTYHLIVKNCNHFCDDVCYKLTGNKIPDWVNRMAKLGKAFNCVLPQALKVTAVQHSPRYDDSDYRDEYSDESERRSLRSSFSFLSSISSRQKQLSTSSILLQSPLKGCLRPWELKKSKNAALKQR